MAGPITMILASYRSWFAFVLLPKACREFFWMAVHRAAHVSEAFAGASPWRGWFMSLANCSRLSARRVVPC